MGHDLQAPDLCSSLKDQNLSGDSKVLNRQSSYARWTWFARTDSSISNFHLA